MKITESMIPLIEKALGFKLYEWQKAYLVGETFKEPTGRRVGRTTAYIVKLLLTNERVIDSNKYKDIQQYKDHGGSHYGDFFKHEMRMIDDKLTSVGLRTCLLKPKKNGLNNIQIGVEMNTGKLQLKLRAIAKHVGALADELDAIDNLKECEACGSYKTVTESLIDDDTNNIISAIVKCDDCGNELPNQLKETTLSIGNASSETGEVIADALKDLPKRLEGSE